MPRKAEKPEPQLEEQADLESTEPACEISQADQIEAGTEGTGNREQGTEQADSAPSDPDQTEVVSAEPKGTYATEYFKANGIPYCDRCGEQFHTDSEGLPVCPESFTDCPRLS